MVPPGFEKNNPGTLRGAATEGVGRGTKEGDHAKTINNERTYLKIWRYYYASNLVIWDVVDVAERL